MKIIRAKYRLESQQPPGGSPGPWYLKSSVHNNYLSWDERRDAAKAFDKTQADHMMFRLQTFVWWREYLFEVLDA
jgi:hypothetical protein